MSRLRVRVADPRALTAQREGPLEFLAVVREHAAQLPADVAIRRSHDLEQKREDRGRGDLTEHEARPGERRSGVTAGELSSGALAVRIGLPNSRSSRRNPPLLTKVHTYQHQRTPLCVNESKPQQGLGRSRRGKFIDVAGESQQARVPREATSRHGSRTPTRTRASGTHPPMTRRNPSLATVATVGRSTTVIGSKRSPERAIGSVFLVEPTSYAFRPP